MPVLSLVAGVMSVLACAGASDSTSPSVADASASEAKTASKTATSSTATTSSATPTAKSHILYGVHSDITWYKDASYRTQAITTATTIHAQVMRIGLLWMWIEYTRGHRDWTVMDDVVNRVVAAGMQPLVTVSGSPEWASGVTEAADEDFYLYVPTDSTKFKQWVADYVDFMKAATTRYKGKVTMWEIGNEQNDAYFWRPRANVNQYATWYVALRTAIKQIDPTAIVALGGMNSLGYDIDANSMRGPAFLSAVYAKGIYPDAVAIHPYSNQAQSPEVHIKNAGNFDDIDLVRNVMVANGQSNAPIWLTEWGWTIDKVSPAVQADYLTKSLNLLETKYSSYVTVATYYSHFDPTIPLHFGLYTHDFVMRPAGAAFRDFMANR